jgi:pyruvate ferredoxin oxidoreductase gamma subunit
MFQVRIHGRGGQGVVTAAEILSIAAFLEGKHAQAFPSFGSERMGAPVTAFCRLDTRPIRLREPIVNPDALIVQDATLLAAADDVFAGLQPNGYVLINAERGLDDLGLAARASALPPGRICTLPATQIALEYLKRPLPNAVLLGGFVALAGQLSLGSIQRAIGEKFSGAAARDNAAAAAAAFERTCELLSRAAATPGTPPSTSTVPNTSRGGEVSELRAADPGQTRSRWDESSTRPRSPVTLQPCNFAAP